MKVLRDGERVDLELVLRAMRPELDRVPPYVYGRGPDYTIVGGLVFQELSRPYLGAWGDWARRAPPRILVAMDRGADEAGRPADRVARLSASAGCDGRTGCAAAGCPAAGRGVA